MTDVRNILIHAYDRVAGEILVDIVRQDIPPLLAAVTGAASGLATSWRHVEKPCAAGRTAWWFGRWFEKAAMTSVSTSSLLARLPTALR
jgi:hypothetical protein